MILCFGRLCSKTSITYTRVSHYGYEAGYMKSLFTCFAVLQAITYHFSFPRNNCSIKNRHLEILLFTAPTLLLLTYISQSSATISFVSIINFLPMSNSNRANYIIILILFQNICALGFTISWSPIKIRMNWPFLSIRLFFTTSFIFLNFPVGHSSKLSFLTPLNF